MAEMTNQERLAELIGEEGRKPCLNCGGSMCDNLVIRPPSELIEIAEGRLFASHGNIKIETHAGWNCVWYDKIIGAIALKFGCKTEQEARMACAIEGLKKLKEEKDAN